MHIHVTIVQGAFHKSFEHGKLCLNMLKLRENKLQVAIVNAYPFLLNFHVHICHYNHLINCLLLGHALVYITTSSTKILGHAHVYVTTLGIL
jgi:hypothetical protein